MAGAGPVSVSDPLVLPTTVMPLTVVSTVMAPWLTERVVVRMSVVLGVSATEMLASEIGLFSLPLSVAGTVSVTVVELLMVMLAVCGPALAPLLVSVVVLASAALMAAAVPVSVTDPLVLPTTVMPLTVVSTVMAPWLTERVVVRMSVVLGVSATEMLASEIGLFSLPLSVAGTVSVTVVELLMVMLAVCGPA